MAIARAGDGLLEVAGDAALEVLGLADVEHLVVGADHAIDAGLLGEGAQEGLGVEGRAVGGLRVGHESRLRRCMPYLGPHGARIAVARAMPFPARRLDEATRRVAIARAVNL
jgi:hypothetical protein